ncbi:dATP/dGTP pyrophosphohydrolase domain-containing protein [Kordiimonas sp. SCSIO 12610]|uniref:dATP/dGTP pyrophosphohydrolase domain-containing protein n=1 Tax=Kordiimonas sp. SCSIO 12610 TaxID=2829597 RepID=UPI00210EFA2A|nr:dATP/dGTP pyrophosphohydrolase domain-containing protein [Kordiimonas sp. SCSIO 12610]UTW54451.1 DUF550 domain-containing protein [Kordiimonas sp. SCSIO 12610]
MQTETQQSIAKWSEETFGPVSNITALLDRALEEFTELKDAVQDDNKPEIANELADILILLYRFAELNGINVTEAIQHKMSINRQRKWQSYGDGTGKHIK